MNYLKICSKKNIIKLILFIIIIAIIIDNTIILFKHMNKNTIAKINNIKIKKNTIIELYKIQKIERKKIFGEQFKNIINNKNYIKQNKKKILSKIIHEIILNNYLKKINFSINKNKIQENILNNINFSKNKIFNYENYLNFLKKKKINIQEYETFIQKQLIRNSFLNNLIQNTNILNYEKNLILKLLSETRTIRTKNINIFSFFKKNKIKNKNLINFYLKYKKIFYYPKKYKIRFIKIQKKKLFNYKYINKEIIPLYLKKKNKIFVQEKRNYSVIQLKTKKESEQIVQKINNGNKFEDCAKKKSIDFISAKKGGNLGWLPLRYIPEEIKKVNIEEKNKKIHIVKYKNNFLVFKLNGKKYQNIKKNNQKNYMIKNKILEKKLKNYVKKYKQKILKLLFLKSYNIHKLSKITKIPYLQTKWLSKNQIYKKFNFNNKKNKIFKINNNKNKFLFLNNNKKYYILEFYKTKNKKNKTFLESKKIIKNIIRYYQAEKKSKKYALKIINVLKSSSKKNKNYFNFSKKKIIHRYDNKPIKSLVFQQPIPKKNRIIYLITSNINNNIKIIILYKNDYKKFSEEKIKKIVKILLKNKKINILNILFDILYKKSLIEYQKNN